MKILALHSIFGEDESKKSAVDLWRIYRPLEELKKHVDWQIDYQQTLIPNIEKYKSSKEFTAEEMQKAYDTISQYDIVFSSYRADATGYTLLKVLEEKCGVQFVMDVDDDMFSINPDNPFWMRMNDEQVYWMQCMIRDNTWISTTNELLADVFRTRREKDPSSVFILPNYICDEYEESNHDNGDKVVIGYFGGSSHYGDIHRTRLLKALKRLMRENKNVYFKSIGIPIDTNIPPKRFELIDGKRGSGWTKELFPTMNMDIALGPLEDNIFNHGKSNIKWQEATRAGAAFVASNIGPYKGLNDVALLVNNTSDDWYNALKKLVDDVEYRKKLLLRARGELKNWELESKWTKYKEMFEEVYASKTIKK